MENIGNPLSANSIARTLKSQGSSVSPDTIDSYLQQMVNAFVLYQCERYDIRGKQRLTTNGNTMWPTWAFGTGLSDTAPATWATS